MTLRVRVLGSPGSDNALFVSVETGQATHTLLFDCGANCPDALPLPTVRSLDHLFFSHLHLDHVAGFDSFLRARLGSPEPVRVWGPPHTARLLQHRLQGVMWNLHQELPGAWHLTDIHPQALEAFEVRPREAFAVRHALGEAPRGPAVLDAGDYRVEAFLLDHRTPSCGYLVREADRVNVDTARLRSLGLTGGPWLRELKERREGWLDVNGERRDVAALREALLSVQEGGSVAYLTDFLLDDATLERLGEALRGCRTLVCEAQYLAADAELAARHHHLTGEQAARLAARAQVGELVLFHVSERYGAAQRAQLLAEARAVFPGTRFPGHWPEGA